MGSSKSVTIGYRYYMGLHFGLSYGPIDSLLNIQVGELEAWTGNHTSSGTIYINKPDLFGGDKREGGIQGNLDLMFGEAAQPANTYLTNTQGALQPAYRGIFSAVFNQGLVSSMTQYIKPWAFKVRRVVAGWGTNDGTAWYSAKAQITLDNGDVGMNPAHIVYQCLTDQTWGMSYDAGMIDDASFTEAADAFYAEGLGLCLAWTRQGSIESFLQIVMDHAGAVVAQDRRTGKFILHAIRPIADPSSLPLFDASNIAALDSFQRASVAETINEVTVNYVDSVTGKASSLTVQNLANIHAQGGVVAQSREYGGLATYGLAARIAERDLTISSTPLAKYKFKANRQAYNLIPGDCIRFSWAKLGITEVVLRILRMDYGDLQNGAITIEAVEDVFSLPSASYAQEQAGLWEPPSTATIAPPEYRLIEGTFRDLVLVAGQTFADAANDTSGFVVGVAVRPTGLSIAFDLHTRVSPADYVEAASGDWSPTGVLTEAVGPTDTFIILAFAADLDQVLAGMPALLGDEIVRVDDIDVATRTVTIARGCVDTVPQPHPEGERFWCLGDWGAPDQTEYTTGEEVDGKFLTATTSGTLAIGSAPSDSVTITGRQGRPYPPGKLRINGLAYPQ